MNRKKKFLGLVAMGLCVGILGGWSFLTTITIRVLGPFYTSPNPFDSTNINQVGGHVQFYLAGDSAWIGQIVSISAKNTAKAVTTIAGTNNVVGVVVGGTRTTMQASIARADSFTLAAIAGQRIIVLDVGRYWVLDSGGALSPGALVRAGVGASTRAAGRAAAALATPDTFYRAIGRMVDTMLTGANGLVQINVK